MNKTNYLRQAVANHVLKGVIYTPPSVRYLALFVITPTASLAGTEVSGGSYARQSCTFVTPVLGVSSNSLIITFSIPTADWGLVEGVGLFDASTGGNMLYFGSLGTPRTVWTGDDMYFPSGYFNLQET